MKTPRVLIVVAALGLSAGIPGTAVAQVGPTGVHTNAAPYLGQQQVRVTVSTVRQHQTVLALSEEVLSCEGSGVGTFDVRMTAEQVAALTQTGIPHEVIINDLGAYIDSIMSANESLADGPWFGAYKTLADIEARLTQLAGQFPTLATLSQIGVSIENRPVRMIRITGPGSTATRPAFVINGTQHAREWVTPMTTMYIIERLLEDYGSDPVVTNLVNRIDFYIVPVANPDGYVFTQTQALWRKNRRPPPTGSSCFGVDTNRNWSVGWGGNNGSSPDPCSETYRGTAAFSEPEPVNIKNIIDTLAGEGRLKVHWDVHSNGQMILSPWGYTTNPPPDLPQMNTLGAIIQTGMQSVRGTPYPYGQGAVILYISSGAARDYPYGTYTTMAWTIEMGGNSFMPPQSEILPIAQEGWQGLVSLAGYYANPLQISTVPPPVVAPNQPTDIAVTITNSSGQYLAGSGKVYTRIGTSGAFASSSLTPQGGSQFQGTLPAAPCGSTIQYYIEASTTTPEIVTFPAGGAASPLSTNALIQTVFLDDAFEAAVPGWTVVNEALTSGAWVRADPVGTTNGGEPAQPEDDHTPSPGVSCYITQNGTPGGQAGAADVDGGPTRLTSPTLDLSGQPGAIVSYAYWHYSVNGSTDPFTVEVSNNNGGSWVQARSFTGQSGWRIDFFNIQDFVPLTAQVRVRFNSRDNPNDSLTESGVDDFKVSTAGCPPTCYPDCNGVGGLTIADFGCFQTKFVAGDPYADCNGVGGLTIADFGCFQTRFVQGCP